MQKLKTWAAKTTKQIAFVDLPIGAEFWYNGHSGRTKNHVFVKIEPFTASAPNAMLAGATTKFWFIEDAPVRIPDPEKIAALEQIAHDRELETIGSNIVLMCCMCLSDDVCSKECKYA